MERKLNNRKGVYLVIVDTTEECMHAVKTACKFANSEGGYVALLNIIEDTFLQNWHNVEKRMQRELREQAEQMIWNAACIVVEETGTYPIVSIEEGDRSDIILDIINDNKNIVALVLAAANTSNPGPLVTYFSGKGLGRLRVPLMVAPRALTEIDS